MPKADLSQLASSGLPNLGGSYDNPSWNRSLQELKIASDSLWTQSAPIASGLGSTGNPPLTGNSSSILNNTSSILGSQRLPELESLRILEGSSSTTRKPNQSSEMGFLRWEEENKKQELKVLSTIVERARAATRKKSQELYEKREQEDWERKRDLWIRELVGTRNLGGSSMEENTIGIALLENGPATTATPMLPPSRRDQTLDYPVDPQIILSHLEVVKRQKGVGNWTEMANAFGKIADASSAVYATALRLVSHILSRPGLSEVEIALATCAHFSGQFDGWMIGKIRKAGLDGQAQQLSHSMFKTPNANTVASFVSLEVGARAETALWPCLYYCLRIGDAAAAKEIFDSTPAAGESDDLRNAMASVLTALAQRQGSSASLWESPGPLVLPAPAIRVVSEVWDMSKGDASLYYRTGVLSLLCGAGELPSTSAAGFATIEDYLFGLLWKALQSPIPGKELENVGKTILGFGAAYFDSSQDSGGWSYALPLLASQQFRTALLYLAQIGGAMGMLQATHLGLLLESAGAKLNNLGESQHQPAGSLLTSLLVDYSNYLLSHPNCGPVCSLEYLQKIPNKTVMMDQVSALILQTQNIEVLGGQTSGDGKRLPGALDQCFSPEDVSLLLKQAAEKCFTDATDREKQGRAAQLFLAAGDYKSLLVMLSKLISPDMDVQNPDKKFWYEESTRFFANYLVKTNPVWDSLERKGQLDAVKTFKNTIDLYEFFTHAANGSFSQAWSILNRLDIFPQSKSEIGEKTIQYKGLDPLLQQRMPSVMVATMQSLYRQHSQLKAVLHTGPQDTTASAMNELKEKASVLVTFAGVISVSQAQMDELSRIEASMI